MSETDLEIVVVLAVAIAALLVALLSFFVTLRASQSTLERLRDEPGLRPGEADARQSYLFDALRHLHAEYEPLRFRLEEACESAIDVIRQLGGRPEPAQGNGHYDTWGTLPHGHYLRIARVYRLLLPAACFHLMQARLARLDPAACRPIHLQYLLARSTCALLARDREVADFFGLVYQPYMYNWRELRETDPQKYRRQGLSRSTLENALRPLIVVEEDGPVQLLPFSRFEVLAKEAIEEGFSTSSMGPALDLFDGFEPEARPVLWRILLVQFVGYRLFMVAARTGVDSEQWLSRQIELLKPELLKLCGSPDLAARVLKFARKHIFDVVVAAYRIPSL